jgi:hypothetical protein
MSNMCLIERPRWLWEMVTRRCNPSWVFPTNIHYGTKTHEWPWATNAYMLSPPSLMRHQCYFISFIGVHLQSGEQVSRTIFLSDLHQERANKVFWEAIFANAQSASSSSSSSLVYLFVNRTRSLIASTMNSINLRAAFRNLPLLRKSHTYSTLWLCIAYWSCWSVYAWSYLIISCNVSYSLLWFVVIYNSLVMFLSYFWLK